MKIRGCAQWALLLCTVICEHVSVGHQDHQWDLNHTSPEQDHLVHSDKAWTRATLQSPWGEKVYNNARLKGCNLLAAMDASDEEATKWFKNLANPGSAESVFQNYPDDFNNWSYTPESCAHDFNEFGPMHDEPYKEWKLDASKKWPARGTFKAVDGANECIGWKHTKATTHNKQVYPAIWAYFDTILNTKDGIIIAWNKFGPANQGPRQRPPVKVFPKLAQWSDVAFLKWKGQGGGSNLRYIWSTSIQNIETHVAIGYALSLSGNRKVEWTDPKDDERWDPFEEDDECGDFRWSNRVEISMDTDAGKALLGSPNGRGAGYMLIQHKATFGERRKITHVTFYCARDKETDGYPWEQNLIFHVSPEEDQEENTENDPLQDLFSV